VTKIELILKFQLSVTNVLAQKT